MSQQPDPIELTDDGVDATGPPGPSAVGDSHPTNEAEPVGDREAPPPSGEDGATIPLVELVLTTGAHPYCDVAGIPRLRRPSDSRDFLPWPIRSRQVEAWVARLFYSHQGTLATQSEIRQVLLVLEGMASENWERDPALEDVIEQEPVLTAVLELLSGQSTWEGTASNLFAELSQIAWRLGIRPDRHPAWPADAPRLSSRLRELRGWLQRAGIEYLYHRSARQRTHFLRKTDDGQASLSSQQPSLPQPAPGGQPRADDAGDADDARSSFNAIRLLGGES